MKHIQQDYLIEYIEHYFNEMNYTAKDKKRFFQDLKDYNVENYMNNFSFQDVLAKLFCDVAFQLEDKIK
mgnify:CR=1 FL=1|tara:strand:- start:394 stop:600 length:207 start_codon:yes stop_codon:yes gene_type:complete